MTDADVAFEFQRSPPRKCTSAKFFPSARVRGFRKRLRYNLLRYQSPVACFSFYWDNPMVLSQPIIRQLQDGFVYMIHFPDTIPPLLSLDKRHLYLAYSLPAVLY